MIDLVYKMEVEMLPELEGAQRDWFVVYHSVEVHCFHSGEFVGRKGLERGHETRVHEAEDRGKGLYMHHLRGVDEAF